MAHGHLSERVGGRRPFKIRLQAESEEISTFGTQREPTQTWGGEDANLRTTPPPLTAKTLIRIMQEEFTTQVTIVDHLLMWDE